MNLLCMTVFVSGKLNGQFSNVPVLMLTKVSADWESMATVALKPALATIEVIHYSLSTCKTHVCKPAAIFF